MLRKATGVAFGLDAYKGWLVRRKVGPHGLNQDGIARVGGAGQRMSRDPETAVRLGQGAFDQREYWGFRGEIFVTDEVGLTPEDVRALLLERENRKRLKLQKAHALQAAADQLDDRGHRQSISRDVKLRVWQRDCGRCIACGSNRDLEYDHIIPVAMGGSNTERNLQLLCAECNRRKGSTLGGEA